MPTSLQRSIALVGAGSLGQHILRALLTSPSHPNVVVLTRPESKNDLPGDLSSATTISVDYTNVAALTTLFKEHSIEVVISVVPPPAYTTVQHALADAAKVSGTVKLFVPSEWGLPTEGAKEKGEENLLAVKDEVAEYLKSIELPYTRFYTGMFMAYVPWLVGIDVDGRVHIQGKGETPFTLTSQEDIGGFVGHVLTSLALTSPELVNASLRIQGQRLTLREYARIVNKPVVTVAQDESLPVKTEGEKAFKTFLQNQVESGKASTGWDRKTEKEIDGAAGSANKLWEGHVWQTVKNN